MQGCLLRRRPEVLNEDHHDWTKEQVCQCVGTFLLQKVNIVLNDLGTRMIRADEDGHQAAVHPRCLTASLSLLWDQELSLGCQCRAASANGTCSLEPRQCSTRTCACCCSSSYTACVAFTGTWEKHTEHSEARHHWDSLCFYGSLRNSIF